MTVPPPRGPAAPAGPDRARLAELDAGLPTAGEAEAGLAAARADPRAVLVLDALAATRATLATAAPQPMPAALAARIRAGIDAIGDDGAGPAPASDVQALTARQPGRAEVGEQPAARRFRQRRSTVLRAGIGALAAAAAAAIVVTAGGPDLPAAPVLALHAADLATAVPAALGSADIGPLADPAVRAQCLRSAGVPGPTGPLLGGRQVQLDGAPGVLLVLPSGVLGSVRLVVVDPGCGPARGTLLAEHTVPG